MATKFFSQSGGGDGSDATHTMSAAQFSAGTGLASGDTAYIIGQISSVLTVPKTYMIVRGDYSADLACEISPATTAWTLFNADKAGTIFRGFTFSIPDAKNVNGIYVNAAGNVEIFDCQIYSSDNYAIYAMSGGVAYVHDCQFTAHQSVANTAIILFSVAGCRVENCTMDLGAGGGVHAQAASVVSGNSFVYGKRKGVFLTNHAGSVVQDNDFESIGWDILYPNGIAAAVEVSGSAASNIITRNRIRNCYIAIHLSTTSGNDENIVSFNYIYKPVVNGISQISDGGIGYNHIYHNTIIHDPKQGNTPPYVGHAIAVQNTARRAKIANNLIVMRRATTDTHGLFISDDARDMSVFVDGNAYSGVSGAALVQNDGVNLTDINEIKASLQADAEIFGMDGLSSSAESHGVVIDDIIDDDGKLHATSRAAHAALVITGVNDGAQTDPWGNTMLTHPNIGADQYDYAPGFGPWSSFDATMPTLALSPSAPGDLRSVQAWSKVASAQEIGKL